MKYRRPLVFVGSRSNMEPLIEIATENGYKILGIADRFYTGQKIEGVDVIGNDLDLLDPTTELNKLVEYCDFFVSNYFTGVTNTDNDNENTFLLRQERINIVSQLNCNLANLIHPDTEISQSVKLGRNILLCKGVVLESHVSIDSFGTFMYHTFVAHRSRVGKSCTLLPDSAVAGYTTLGHNVVVGVNTRILNTVHPQTVIGNNVIIGPGLHILKDIPNDSIVRIDGKIVENTNFISDLYNDSTIISTYQRLIKETKNENI